MFNLKAKEYTTVEKAVSVLYLVFAAIMMMFSVYWLFDGWGSVSIADYVFYAACIIVSIYTGVLAGVALLGFKFDRPSS